MLNSAELRDAALGGASTTTPTVWILLGGRTGDDNQLRALAEALGWPFQARTLQYNGLHHFPFLRDERLRHLTQESRAQIRPPWPDVVIGLGYESISVARHIRRQSGGRARLVHLGNPRTNIADIDLLIKTPQYPLPAAPNLLEIPLPIGNPTRDVVATDGELQWLNAMPKPRRLIAIGGSTRQWKLDVAKLEEAVRHLTGDRMKHGGSVIAATSRRTPPEVTHLLKEKLCGESEAVVSNFPRFPLLLSNCDEVYVTADSVSMLSEAMLTGKPVGMIPVRRSNRGLLSHALRRLGVPLKPKADLSAFWSHLISHKLVGSVDEPTASAATETTSEAADAVRAMIERPPQPKIWALLGAHRGDNNQVMALAEAMGLPFEIKQLTYNRWRHLGPHLLGATFRSLTPSSRALLSTDLPDLTISSGHRSVAAVQFLRKRSAGRTQSIHVGYPRVSPGKFDLVIATPEYPVREHPNLLRIPFALTRRGDRNEGDSDFWDRLPSPRRLLVLGGPTLYWRLDLSAVSKALDDLLKPARADGGSVIVVGSPRTSRRLLKQVENRLRDGGAPTALVAAGGQPTYAELLGHADTICVTADSVAMVSDAIATGKPVGLVPVLPTGAGQSLMALMDRLRPGERVIPRDLRAFWHVIQHRGLVGTVCEPRSVKAPDVNSLSARRSQAILDRGDSIR